MQTVNKQSFKMTSVLLLLPLRDHIYHFDYFVATVYAVYACVSIIHPTLTWTTGSLTCVHDLFAYVYTQDLGL